MKYTLLFALPFTIMVAKPAGAEDALLRVECRKDSSRGCTASYTVCYDTPGGHYIKGSTLSLEGTLIDHFGTRPVCGIPNFSRFTPYIISDTDIETQLPTSFCAQLHVESGSGITGIGKVAYISCKYSFETRKMPN